MRSTLLLCVYAERRMYIKSFKIQSCPERFDLYGDYRRKKAVRALCHRREQIINMWVHTHTVPEVYKTNKPALTLSIQSVLIAYTVVV